MISIDGLAVEFGGTTLFSDISFVINEKDRIALMGKNGAGKSTLLKILAGVRQPTRGKISAPKDCVIAYLPQHLMTEDGRTVFQETAQAFAHLHEMEAEIDRMNKELETRTDYESDSYMELIEQVSALSEKFYAIDATNYEEDVEKALLGLGFTREDFNRQTSDFSGGWRMRIELAKLLLQKPDVLLLDEPTNHLDIESIQWLEEFLINNGKAVIVISHDRKFVDNITTRTIEVTMGRIPGAPQRAARTATKGIRRPTEVHRRNQRIHRALQGNLFQNPASAEPRQDAGKAGASGSGRRRYFGIAAEIPALAALRQLSGDYGERRKDIRRPCRVQECQPHYRERRQSGFRRQERRR
jgi:ATPase subunit of ABC transporter with duplicated ATPase domains